MQDAGKRVPAVRTRPDDAAGGAGLRAPSSSVSENRHVNSSSSCTVKMVLPPSFILISTDQVVPSKASSPAGARDFLKKAAASAAVAEDAAAPPLTPSSPGLAAISDTCAARVAVAVRAGAAVLMLQRCVLGHRSSTSSSLVSTDTVTDIYRAVMTCGDDVLYSCTTS